MVENPPKTLAEASDYAFPGPDPVMIGPSKNKIAKARGALYKAQMTGKGISMADAETLLAWSVHHTRACHEQGYQKKGKEPFQEASGSLWGSCGWARNVASFGLDTLGLAIYKPHVVKIFPDIECITRHGFTIAKIPIQTADGIRNAIYLIDTTYRQFFDPTSKAIEPLNLSPRDDQNRVHDAGVIYDSTIYDGPGIPNTGLTMTRTEEGRALTDAILRNGYVELDEKKAMLYLTSLTNGVPPSNHSAIEALMEPAFQAVPFYDGYPLDKLEEWFGTSPSHRMRQAEQAGYVGLPSDYKPGMGPRIKDGTNRVLNAVRGSLTL